MGAETTTHDDDLALIVGQYVLGQLTIGQAAERANMSRWEMQEFLQDYGVPLRLGPQTEAELRREVDTALNFDDQ